MKNNILQEKGASPETRFAPFVKKANWIRNKVLEITTGAGAGHVAPSFSCTEILVALHYGFLALNPSNPKDDSRDRFVLSKGQAAVALYCVLADLGFFPVEELSTFTREGSRLGGHTEDTIPGVEAFTGSLGHGLSVACGMALAARMDRKPHFAVTLLGDGECHEGSVWEAAMFASQHKLGNMIAIVDNNGLSATDHLKNYLDVSPMEDKWRSFGWETVNVDGHDFESLFRVLDTARSRSLDKPLAIIAKTIKGKGVSFMENQPIWHYRIPVGEELETAKQELKDQNS